MATHNIVLSASKRVQIQNVSSEIPTLCGFTNRQASIPNTLGVKERCAPLARKINQISLFQLSTTRRKFDGTKGMQALLTELKVSPK